MAFRKRREALRSILSGSACIRPDRSMNAISIRIAQDLASSSACSAARLASLAVLGDPDIALITLTNSPNRCAGVARGLFAGAVDADHGYGNALNVRRTVEELETAVAAGLTIEDTLLPQAFGQMRRN